MIQFIFNPIKLSKLHGAFELKVMPELTTSSWNNQNYQDCTTIFLKDQTPFRAELIKLRNQIDYSCYKKINTILTLGKENYIFDPAYIKARTGEDLISNEILDKKMKSILATKKLLDSLGIPILVCIAPNKANFYPEKLKEQTSLSPNRNQTFFENKLTTLGIKTINFDSLFVSKKNNSKYTLIPKYGAHWSTYGAYIAADILFSNLDDIVFKKTTTLKLDSIYLTTTNKFSDDDYLQSLNLIKKLNSPLMAYPLLKIDVKNKLNVLAISDSFFWNFYDLNLPFNCFTKNSELWYYNKTKFDINKNEIGKTNDYLSLKDLKNRDVIIILSSDPSLINFGFGFFEQMEQLNGI